MLCFIIILGFTLYADDILLLRSSVLCLQIMLDKCSELATLLLLEFNVANTHCVVIGQITLVHLRGNTIESQYSTVVLTVVRVMIAKYRKSGSWGYRSSLTPEPIELK